MKKIKDNDELEKDIQEYEEDLNDVMPMIPLRGLSIFPIWYFILIRKRKIHQRSGKSHDDEPDCILSAQ